MGPHLGHCPSRVAGSNPFSRRRFGADIARTRTTNIRLQRRVFNSLFFTAPIANTWRAWRATGGFGRLPLPMDDHPCMTVCKRLTVIEDMSGREKPTVASGRSWLTRRRPAALPPGDVADHRPWPLERSTARCGMC